MNFAQGVVRNWKIISLLQIMFLCLIYVFSWAFFAALYLAIAAGDDKCFDNMSTFNAAFVFSISSQVSLSISVEKATKALFQRGSY